jgi:choline dehydrogenase-like flavoprotein
VLAAGGIENPRLLLAANRQNPAGIGNGHGLVGRYLMDHPRTTLGVFPEGAAAAVLGHFGVVADRSGARMQRGLSLSPQFQRSRRLLNAAAWAVYDFAADDVWYGLRAARHRGAAQTAQAGMLLRHADQVMAGLWARYVRKRPMPRRVGPVEMHMTLEQVPNPDSRVSLSDQRDAFGVPIPRIDWKISAMERCTGLTLGQAVDAALAGADLPRPALADWIRDNRPEDATFLDVAHPTGTTRMAHSAEDGVVDPDCRIFGVDNLYVAGSSVFPTGGHANPTLMVVALALRLAETLRTRCRP